MYKALKYIVLFISVFSFAQERDSVKNVIEKQIEMVEIIAKKKLIERKVDRLIFNVESSVSAIGGDALDALKITPGIRIQNDQISMIGKSNMAIMIDDRIIQLSGDDLINFLKTIRSDDIKSIEIITAPPSKYDAEGNSGLINFRLKKIKTDSISGNMKTSYTQAKYSLVNVGGSFNYIKNKLSVNSNINYGNGTINPYQEYTLLFPNYRWFEINKKKIYQNILSGRIAIDYKLNKKTVFGIQYSGSSNQPIRNGSNTSFINNNSSYQLDSLISSSSYLKTNKKIQSLNFHSLTKFDTIGKQIAFDLDIFHFKSHLNNNFSSNTYLPDGTIMLNSFFSANNISNQNIKIYSSKVDVEIPSKWINLSFGSKLSFIENDSDVDYFNTIVQPELDLTKSDTFKYSEYTQALYFSGSKSLSKKWDTQVGLRIENTQIRGYSKTLDQINTSNYIKFFPSIYLSYKVNDDNVITANYSKRINRPSYSNLNPFRLYSSSYNYSEGNPFLQPFFIDNIELSHTYKNLYTTIYLNYIKNGFDQITFVSPNNNSQIVKPYNFFKQATIGLIENYTFNKWKWWESNNQLNIYNSQTSSNLSSLVAKLNRWTFAFNSTNSFNINKSNTLKAELAFNYQSPSISGSYNLSDFYYLDAAVKFSLVKKTLQISLNAIDIFRSNKLIFSQVVNGITQVNYDYSDNQKIRLSVTYIFGKSLKVDKREQSNEEEQKRVK